MSFAVWNQHPPFPEESLTPGEKIYQVGDKWVVTDQGQPTQAQIDALFAAATVAPSIGNGALSKLLVSEGVIKQAALDAAIAEEIAVSEQPVQALPPASVQP